MFWCLAADLKKKDWIERPIVSPRQDMKPGYFECCHLGETTSRATSLDLRSEDYQSKTSRRLLENPCTHSSHRCVIHTSVNRDLTAKESHQDGRRKFLVFKNEKRESYFFFFLSVCLSDSKTRTIIDPTVDWDNTNKDDSPLRCGIAENTIDFKT